MAPTSEMLAIAIKTKPHSVCLVPEKRHELTTEGGLDVVKHQQKLAEFITVLQQHNILVSLFLNTNLQHIKIAKNIGANIIELHTGEFCRNFGSHKANELYEQLTISANLVKKLGLFCHAGHGLNYQTAFEVAKIKEITELNIGHFIIGESIFYGLTYVVQKMQKILKQARA
jgi:pyridoxine 5-phosphate synthase